RFLSILTPVELALNTLPPRDCHSISPNPIITNIDYFPQYLARFVVTQISIFFVRKKLTHLTMIRRPHRSHASHIFEQIHWRVIKPIRRPRVLWMKRNTDICSTDSIKNLISIQVLNNINLSRRWQIIVPLIYRKYKPEIWRIVLSKPNSLCQNIQSLPWIHCASTV